jgi:hypothetical protein
MLVILVPKMSFIMASVELSFADGLGPLPVPFRCVLSAAWLRTASFFRFAHVSFSTLGSRGKLLDCELKLSASFTRASAFCFWIKSPVYCKFIFVHKFHQ